MAFFRERLISEDRLPLGFADGKVSLDAQNVAQCVQTLLVAARDDADADTAVRVWEEAERRGRSPLRVSGSYASLRWSLGPGVLAAAWLTTNERFQSSSENSKKI
jgi:hypothetical protein